MENASNKLQNVVLGQIRSVSEKAINLERIGQNVIHLEFGEPNFSTPNHIVESAKSALEAGETYYASNRGIFQLREAISIKMKVENNINADPKTEVLVTQGAAEGLALALLAHCNTGDEVLIIEPSFTSYKNLIYLAGATPISVPTEEKNNWIVEPNDILNAITSKSKMIILNSPCNPTGAVYPKETLETIATYALKYNLLIVSDEIYEKIIFKQNNHFSIGSIDEVKNRVITINGFSKAYAMTGWRLGYIAADKNLINNMLKIHQYIVTCVPTFSQYGAIAAYSKKEKSESSVSKMMDAYTKRRNIVYERLNSINGITLSLPEGAFYAFANISQFNLSSKEFSDKLLNDVSVATVPGSIFSSIGEGYVRISFANSEENLREAMNRIEHFIFQITK